MSQTPAPKEPEIEIDYDGKFQVSYKIGDAASAFRVDPAMGRLIASLPALTAERNALKGTCEQLHRDLSELISAYDKKLDKSRQLRELKAAALELHNFIGNKHPDMAEIPGEVQHALLTVRREAR